MLKNNNRNLNSGANVKYKLKTKQYFCKKQLDEILLQRYSICFAYCFIGTM